MARTVEVCLEGSLNVTTAAAYDHVSLGRETEAEISGQALLRAQLNHPLGGAGLDTGRLISTPTVVVTMLSYS